MMDVRFDFWTAAVATLAFAGLYLLLKRARWGISWIRFAVFLLLVWFILEPSVAVSPPADAKPELAVLLDVSRSMGIADPEPRIEKAQSRLAALRQGLEQRFKVSYYQFSESASRLGFDQLMKAKPSGQKTDIPHAVDQVFYERKQNPPALLIVSDGMKTASLQKEEPAWPAPVFTLGTGNREGLTDVSLSEPRVSDFAFKGRPVELSVTLRNDGFSGTRVPVILREVADKSERDVQVQEVRFTKPSGETNVAFKFTPSSVGRLKYRLAVPVQKGEIAKLNNQAEFNLEVGREKLRILYLCGQPSPEYSFLRQVLKSDPSIDLVSFVILRNPENVVPVPEEQLSLIPFPANDIFVRTLPEFDLLIFENFSYARFGILQNHLENIRRFVEERGGGFLMIGGENSFGRGNYANSPIDALLPVQLDTVKESLEDDRVTMKVVDPEHPIFAFGDSAAENRAIWQNLPALEGYYKLPGLKNGASLLASSAESGAPLIAGWRKGKGRVIAMATLSTWQWALGLSEKGFMQSDYTQFWRQTVRWLTSLEDAKEIRMILSQTQCAVGKPLSIQIFTRSGLSASGDRNVTLSVAQEGGAPTSIPIVSIGRNEFRAEWIPEREGRYDLTAELREGLRRFSAQRSVTALGADVELENPYPDHEYLKSVSQKTGGEFFELDRFAPENLEGKIRSAQNAGSESARKSLSSSPWLLALAAGLLLAEWAIRRFRNEL